MKRMIAAIACIAALLLCTVHLVHAQSSSSWVSIEFTASGGMVFDAEDQANTVVRAMHMPVYKVGLPSWISRGWSSEGAYPRGPDDQRARIYNSFPADNWVDYVYMWSRAYEYAWEFGLLMSFLDSPSFVPPFQSTEMRPASGATITTQDTFGGPLTNWIVDRMVSPWELVFKPAPSSIPIDQTVILQTPDPPANPQGIYYITTTRGQRLRGMSVQALTMDFLLCPTCSGGWFSWITLGLGPLGEGGHAFIHMWWPLWNGAPETGAELVGAVNGILPWADLREGLVPVAAVQACETCPIRVVYPHVVKGGPLLTDGVTNVAQADWGAIKALYR